jgi:hypothetical protein
LTTQSTGGTGHLLRHRISCARKADHAAKSQSVLNYASDGSVRSWDYNPETARIELCHLIARIDLPLGIDAYDAFVEYIQRAHNPIYMSLFVGKQPLKILFSILIKLELLCWIA